MKDLWQEHENSDGTVLGVGLHGKEEQEAAQPHHSLGPRPVDERGSFTGAGTVLCFRTSFASPLC